MSNRSRKPYGLHLFTPDPFDGSVVRVYDDNGVEQWKMLGVHGRKQCLGTYCVVHNPSGHHMRTWPLGWERDDTLIQRRCVHDVLHPDPDSRDYFERIGDRVLHRRCCGCCVPHRPIRFMRPTSWPGQPAWQRIHVVIDDDF